MRRTRALSGTAALVAIATLGGGCTGQPAAPPEASTVSGANTYDPRQLLVGRVTRDGEAVAGVSVEGALSLDDLEDVRIGDEVEAFPLGTSTTDADGDWSFVLDVDDVPRRFLVGGERRGATVNVDLMMNTSDGLVLWSVPVSRTAGPDATAAWRSREQDDVGDPPHRIDVDLGAGSVRDISSDGEVTEGTTGF